jgi:ABC-type branched-subunit amino acid transport system substrate-binding protein
MLNTHRILVVMLILALLVPTFVMVQAQDDCSFADETIKFGGLAPMSAPGAVAGGVAMDWAFKQAAEDINADCGIQIEGVNYRLEVITGDSEGSPERAQAAAERLILDEGVNGMVGAYHSAVGLATMGIMQENEIPTVFSEPWNDNVSANGIQDYENQPARITTNEAGIDYIFRVAPSSSMVGGAATDWMIAMGFDDVIWIVENTDYGQPAAADEIARMQTTGATTEKLDIELGTEDFIPVLSRIQARANPPDMIRVLVTGETSFNLTQQMAELGIAPNEDTACMTNQIAFQSEQFWATVPDGTYCVFQRVGIIPALFNDLAVNLNAAYEAEFGDIVASFAMESYDSVWILADAMERAGTYSDGAAIVTALEATDIVLTQGHYYFKYGSHNPDIPEGVPAYMWHQWPDPIVTVMQYFEQGQSSLDAAVIWPPVYQTHGTQYIVPGTMPDM